MKIVLLPGLDGTGILFKPLIESLPSDIEPLVISYPNNKKMNYDDLTDYVINQLPKEDFILLGESFSGPIAYRIALRNPPNLKSIIFVASFLSNPRDFILKLWTFLPVGFLFSLPIPKFIIKSFLFGKEINKRLISLFRESLNRVPAGILSFRLREITKLYKEYLHCGTRAIYIQASSDKLVPSESVKNFLEVLDNLTVYEVKGPHFILQTNPSACSKIITNEVHYCMQNEKNYSTGVN